MLENLLNATVLASGLAEPVQYAALPSGPVPIRAIFDLTGTEIDLETGIRVATGVPHLALRNSDIGREAQKDDTVTARGIAYVVQSVLPSGSDWSECKLRVAA